MQSEQASGPLPASTTVEPPTPWRWKQVFNRELEHVRARRKGASPKDLVGIAISGGGIRSATFALGILETLRERGVLKRIDYLSTVSGGGYIGSWLTANCHRAAARQLTAMQQLDDAIAAKHAAEADLAAIVNRGVDRDPVGPADVAAQRDAMKLVADASDTVDAATEMASQSANWLEPDSVWSKSIDHLRRYSNYLSPTLGFLSADTWSMVAIWIRNTVLVQATVIFGIAVALMVPHLLYPGFIAWPEVGHWRWTAVALFVFGVAGIAGNLLRVTNSGSRWLQLSNAWLGVALTALLLAVAWGIGHMSHFEPFSNEPVSWVAIPIAGLIVGAGFCVLTPGIGLINLFWRLVNKLRQQFNKRSQAVRPPTEINYGQGWVQFAIVVPMMATGYFVAAVLWGQIQSPELYKQNLQHINSYGLFFTTAWQYWQLPLSVAFASLWGLSWCSMRDRKRPWHRVIALAAPLVSVAVLHALLAAILLLMKGWSTAEGCDIRTPETCRGDWLAFMWGPALVLYSLALSITILIGMLGRQSTEGVREWWSRLGAWMLIYGGAWLIVSVAAVYGPMWVAMLLDPENLHARLSIVGAWIATTIGGLLAGRSNSTGSAKGDKQDKSLQARALDLVARLGPLVFIAGLLVLVAMILHLIITVGSNQTCCNLHDLAEDHWALLAQPDYETVAIVFGGAVGLLLLFAMRVDINEFSLNAFYRNRLTRCYLGATRYLPNQRHPQNFTGFDDDDDVPLSHLRMPGADGRPAVPIHLVNCALNLGGSADLSLHTRHSAAFTFSQYAAGTQYRSHDNRGVTAPIGYQPVETFCGVKTSPTLGQVVSVSGAAASPNMGYHTSPIVAFLLTVFNVRLGAWFPNPRENNIRIPSPWFGLRYLVKELFGGADDKARFVMLSDGGHFENLAAYELIRRRCRVIVICDGECDPNLQFEGLGTLIRMCDVDFNAQIDVDVNAIKLRPDTLWSERRCAVGTIRYSDDDPDGPQCGILIYLKASMTGHEDSATLQYKASHPRFPHETTANQFYGEDQFESYRRLGHQISARTLAPVLDALTEQREQRSDGTCQPQVVDVADAASATVARESDLIAAAETLRVIWSSSLSHLGRFSHHGKDLISLWQQIAANPASRVLSKADEALLAKKWPDENSDKTLRDVYFVCTQMLQLMENVYLDLNLEETWINADNEGWRNLFGSWASSPALGRTWEVGRQNYGGPFRSFCERKLGLRAKPSTGDPRA